MCVAVSLRECIFVHTKMWMLSLDIYLGRACRPYAGLYIDLRTNTHDFGYANCHNIAE